MAEGGHLLKLFKSLGFAASVDQESPRMDGEGVVIGRGGEQPQWARQKPQQVRKQMQRGQQEPQRK